MCVDKKQHIDKINIQHKGSIFTKHELNKPILDHPPEPKPIKIGQGCILNQKNICIFRKY